MGGSLSFKSLPGADRPMPDDRKMTWVEASLRPMTCPHCGERLPDVVGTIRASGRTKTEALRKVYRPILRAFLKAELTEWPGPEKEAWIRALASPRTREGVTDPTGLAQRLPRGPGSPHRGRQARHGL